YTFEELADIHFTYGAADGNGREAARIYLAKFSSRCQPHHHSTFAFIHRRLRATEKFK
ncbi:hypothetical protein EAI_12596, partial [Harpegnathos saltator]